MVGVIAVASSLLTGSPLLALFGVIVAEISRRSRSPFARPSVTPTPRRSPPGSSDGAAGLVANAGVDDFNDLTVLLYPIHHTVANFAVVLAVAVGRLAPASQTAAEPTNRQSVPIRPTTRDGLTRFPRSLDFGSSRVPVHQLERRSLTSRRRRDATEVRTRRVATIRTTDRSSPSRKGRRTRQRLRRRDGRGTRRGCRGRCRCGVRNGCIWNTVWCSTIHAFPRHVRAEDRGRDRGMVPWPEQVTHVMEQRGHDVLGRASVAVVPRVGGL